MITLGIDGGGTKTIFSLCDEEGQILCTLHRPTVALPQVSEEDQRQALLEGLHACLQEAELAAGAKKKSSRNPPPKKDEIVRSVSAVCFGAPLWGESEARDEAMRRNMNEVFRDIPWLICNDAQVAWAGSFGLRPGINILAGTGAMAFGMDSHGNTARCGGWGEHFADEGSGYWLGMRMLSLFCKEADGRVAKGALYPLVRERFHLRNDFDIAKAVLQDVLPDRTRVADLQLLLLEAARQGDENAIACYREAGCEIALNVEGILKKLDFSGGAEVSYSGGIFKAGALVMDSFRQTLEARGCILTRPLAPPWAGALMLALQLVKGDSTEVLDRLTQPKLSHDTQVQPS